MSGAVTDGELPKPFYVDGWPREKRPHAKALWNFHTALTNPRAPALDGSDLTAYFLAERDKVLSEKPLKIVPQSVGEGAYDACSRYGLPVGLLARQVEAARRFMEPIRFENNREVNAFIMAWAGSHGRLLARLAGAGGTWQLVYADELSTGFFWVGRLMTLRHDVEKDHVFIPKTDLKYNAVTIEQLRDGHVDESMKRVLWKQTIRAKNAFAQSEPLALELPRRYASSVKRWWLGGLEVLNEIERREYDVWSEPISLSRFHRVQVRFQARFGRTTFRSR